MGIPSAGYWCDIVWVYPALGAGATLYGYTQHWGLALHCMGIPSTGDALHCRGIPSTGDWCYIVWGLALHCMGIPSTGAWSYIVNYREATLTGRGGGHWHAQSARFSPCLCPFTVFSASSPKPPALIGPPIPYSPLHLSLSSLRPASCPLDTPAPQCSHHAPPSPASLPPP